MNEVTTGVFQLVCATFGCAPSEVTRDTQAEDIDGWDSLSHSVLLVGIERRFAVRLNYDDVFDVSDVGGLIDYVSDAVRGKTGAAT